VAISPYFLKVFHSAIKNLIWKDMDINFYQLHKISAQKLQNFLRKMHLSAKNCQGKY